MNTRRWGFVALGVVALVAAALAGSILWVQGGGVAAAPGPAPSAQITGSEMAPLAEAPCTEQANTRTCKVWALPGALTMPDGATLPAYGFGTSAAGPALVPGPVITVTQGMTLEVVLYNGIPTETAVSLAFPGQEGLVPDMDGLAAGEVATYTFGADTAGTFIYEAGLTEGGARQVAMGLAGPLIIEGGTPAWDQEVVLALSAIDPDFNRDPHGFSMNDFRAKYWLINGQAYPDVGWIGVMTDTTVLMRYLNVGVEYHTLGTLGIGQQMIASNGEALPFPEGAVAPAIAPGQTLDTLIEIPAGAETDTLYPLYNGSLLQHNNNQRMADGRAAFGGMLTFLRVTTGGPAGPAGPVASNVTVTPQRTRLLGVDLTADLTDAAENVVNYECYVDTPGTLAKNGAIGTPAHSVDVTVHYSLSELNTLASGEHLLYIRGQDAAGNWGPFGSTVLNLDQSGPAISGLSLHPNPANGDRAVTLRATADERKHGDGQVTAAFYRFNGSGWQPMTLNMPGSSVSALRVDIPAATVAAAADGEHVVEVMAVDDLLNATSPYGVTTLRVDKTGPTAPTVTLTPNVLDFSQPYPTTVRLDATIEDALAGGVQSALSNAEGFIDTQGAPGTGFALYPADGLFDEPLEEAYYSIPASHFRTLPDGVHQVIVVGKDVAGNWGVAGSAAITVSGSLGLQGEKDGGVGPAAPQE
jgi:FtsP/CotA-like multicopper oxidase with cupredoxin domain